AHTIDPAERATAPSVPPRPPRVGVISAWFDPELPGMWSNVPAGVVDELKRLGVYAGRRDATAWAPLARVIYRRSKRSMRDEAWTLRKRMRPITRATEMVLRAMPDRDVDGWIHFVGANGPVVRGRYVTLFEMSPAQILEAGRLGWAGSFGYPGATLEQLAWVARRQVVLYRNAYTVCMSSRWAADSLVRDHGIDARKIRIVGYGRNGDPRPPEHRDWSFPRFLFIGRDWRRKNGDAMVRAFARLRSEVPAARLDVVGNHPLIGVEGVVEHGVVPGHEPEGRAKIEALYAAASCFMLPSFIEPFGLSCLEAGAAGLPSITTKVGGMAESVGPGGILVDPYDDDDIYRAMRTLSDSDTARVMGEAALARAPLFTWGAVAQRVVRALDLAPVPGVELAGFL
ncbi:MAG: glycosyltransferase family 4 protein, partial [Actinomycetota bacterium]